MFVEILIGTFIALAFIVGAVFLAFRTDNLNGLSKHNIRGNGDYSGGQDSFDGGADGGD
jgi:hypothetical protein